MRAQVQKWGNSLALRIPKALASDTGLSPGAEVELSVVQGRLVVAPLASWRARLDDLIDRITDENVHQEIRTGPPVGEELL